MKKGLFLLAFLAFTFSVKAEGTGGYTSDIVIAEGEEISFESVLAAQNTLRNDGWFENCVSGSEIRVYTDYLPNDDSITLNTKVLDVKDANSTPWTYKTVADPETHSSFEWFYLCQQSDTDTVNAGSDEYEKYIQYDTSQDLVTGYEYVSQEELSRVNALQYANTYTANDSAGVQGARARAYNRTLINNAVMLPNAGVMLNNLHITITNAQGQTTAQFDTNIVVKLDQILQQVTRIKNDTSTIVSELMFLANAFGFDGSVGSSTSNFAEFLGQWRTADGVWQAEILDTLTNSIDNIDYTDYLRLLTGADGYTTNRYSYIQIYNILSSMVRHATNGRYAFSGTTPYLALYGVPYNTWQDKMNNLSSFFFPGDDTLLSYEALGNYLAMREQYQDQYIEMRKYGQLTNIINGIDLGRDWLNLATNDISSLPYWLNQQATGGNLIPGQTNSLNDSAYRFNLLTNQYAQISLTGSNPSNSGENWNYFKRLEMLLAAIVYKQTDLSKIGEADDDNGTELANDTTVSAAVSAAEQDVSTSLSTVASSLSLTGLESSKNNLVSLWQIAVGAFDTPGSKPQITIFEQDEVGGDNNSSGAVNLDFSQGAIGDFCDFCHHLFGFLWSFGSLFIFWKVAKYCWDMGYRVVRFHYSLCRKFLGI